jgi:hypothetical protein
MPSVGFEPTIPAFERAKTINGLNHAATVIGSQLFNRIHSFGSSEACFQIVLRWTDIPSLWKMSQFITTNAMDTVIIIHFYASFFGRWITSCCVAWLRSYFKEIAAPVWKTEINGSGDPLRWPRDTLYLQNLALTSPTSGGRSVGIVRLRTQATEFVFLFVLHGYGILIMNFVISFWWMLWVTG